MKEAVALGGDTDTAAAIVGGILGCQREEVEGEISWLSQVRLPRADELEATATGLYELRRSLYQQVPQIYQPWQDNWQGSGAAGLMQFMPGTWRWMSRQAGYAGASPYDPWSAAHVAAWAIRNGYLSHRGGGC